MPEDKDLPAMPAHAGQAGKTKKRNLRKKTVLFFLVFCFGLLVVPTVVFAGKTLASWASTQAACDEFNIKKQLIPGVIAVYDSNTSTCKAVRQGAVERLLDFITQMDWEDLQKALGKAGSVALKKAIHEALITIASDTAKYIGSGGKGQKPLFIKEGWDEYLKNIANNAGGRYIENLDKQYGLNLCHPSPAVKTRIGLGLVAVEKPKAPDCTFSQMVQNWDKELQRKDFLSRFQNMFEPTSSDLGIALSAQTGALAYKDQQLREGELFRIGNRGWLTIENIAGQAEGIPLEGEARVKQLQDLYTKSFGEFTGDALIDAANVFLNQLAITALNKLLASFGKNIPTYTSPYAGNYGGYEAGPITGGEAGVKEKTRKLAETKFNTRGDYDILAELTQCPNPTKAGPTNCVIDDKFRQAISEKLTVGEAMERGYLNAGGVFGFTADGLEPSYNEAYPYRSMLILRKFRIVPVGWEIAAQYIKKCPQANAECFLGIDGTKNLADLVACFDPNDDYTGYNDNGSAVWCEGLVDPAWVLKAPLNYCKREGPGPEILSEQVTGGGEESELTISRKDNYCADEQSCIKEKDDGSCELYGYCTEERRKWQFNGKSCDPTYNTCQTFRASDGRTVSYLENSLDYSFCSVDTAGCKGYCEDYDNANGVWTCDSTSGAKLYLDRDAEECDAESEGCREFIRTKAGIGANLLPNSSFEDDSDNNGIADGWLPYADGSSPDGVIRGLVDDSVDGYKSQRIVSGPIINNDSTYGGIEFLLTSSPIIGEKYTISFYAKGKGPNYKAKFSHQSGGLESCLSFDFDLTLEWKRYSKTCIMDKSVPEIYFWSDYLSEELFIDAIKLERGDNTPYDDYQASGLVYEKLLPPYLEDDCYNDAAAGDYTLKNNASAECSGFARKCNASEAGCELYTSDTSGTSVPAQVIASDYCPAECVGYDTYIQKETVFDSLRAAYFIPQTARSCGAAVNGCDEFTNLDKVEQGGEGREYYTYLKQCIKPSLTECADFYTWEGSDETGYQLKVFQMKKDAAIGAPPFVPDPDDPYKEKYCKTASDYDPANNPACRQFYNTAGDIFYRFYPYTIACSENCQPYRRAENNVDPAKPDLASCGGVSCSAAASDGQERCWDNTENVCYYCKSGGKWNSGHQACLYDAIPGEGEQCSAASVGCREYAGNIGNNTMLVLNNNFEGSAQGWIGTGGTQASVNNKALMAGGHSLYVSGGIYQASTTVGQLVDRGNAYVLSFIAQSESGSVILSAELDNGSVKASFSGSAALNSGEWRLYELSLAELDHSAGDGESLVITGANNFYIDDIKLTEITDRYYLIKNSWQTPNTCFEDIAGNPVGALYNLGCDSYRDRDGNIHYLRSFNSLCQESAVGCELMIDTQNSSDFQSAIYNDANASGACENSEPDCVNVPADSYTYAVYDKTKLCGADSKGCQRLGDYYKHGSDYLFSDIYLENNPDKYNVALCSEEAVGCAEWTSAEGTSYFKDPSDQVCEWRQSLGQTGSWGWYKKKVKRCDTDGDGIGDGGLCLKDSDCSSSQLCKLEATDTACAVNAFKTFGYGGNGSKVEQPTYDDDGFWAGLCPASQAGCSEYIDPVSRFSANAVFNSDFSQDVDLDTVPDGWSAAVNANGVQDISLNSYTLYIFTVTGVNTAEIQTSAPSLYELDSNNVLGPPVSKVSINSTDPKGRVSKVFYAFAGFSDPRVSASDYSLKNGSKIEVKEAAVDYQLKQELDKISCNGVIDFSDGCVLFNERIQNGLNLAGLIYDADRNEVDPTLKTPYSPNPSDGSEDSNSLIKVKPDRVCDQWLACRSLASVQKESGEKENVCYDIGLCDRVDANGNCANFVLEKKMERNANLPGDFSQFNNASGYTKVGLGGIVDITMRGDYPFGTMDQLGEIVYLPNGNFEISGDNGYPLGWVWEGGTWDASKFKIIDNPYTAQTEGIGYAPEGRNFLKLGTAASSTSEFADVIGNTDYILTAYVNTINLATGTAKLNLKQFTSNSLFIGESNLISYESGNDWSLELASFKTDLNASRIKIVLYTDSTTTGNFYFDDIKLRPALNSRTNWYTPQSCRLYPEDDSLSCDYYDDSGIRRKGWPGYCLEYDRPPGSTDACVVWWPVDKVKGDGVEEGAGYIDKVPVYYCLDSQRIVTTNGNATETGRVLITTGNRGSWGNIDNCDGNGRYTCSCPTTLSAYGIDNNNPPLPIGTSKYSKIFIDVDDPNYPTQGGDRWMEVTCELEVTTDMYCTKVVQTVSTAGQNKYWSGRVYQGSNYSIACNNIINITGLNTSCTYASDDSPFGSIVPPVPDTNPYEWDSDSSKLDIQPLWYGYAGSPYEKSVRMGQKHILDYVKRLFAQSYGGWEWVGDQDNGRYMATSSLDWGSPTTLCNGAGTWPRPAYPNDYCSILPQVSNIKVNNQDTADVILIKNQFVNFTFNTEVDAEQMPMVMYAIDWGDNEKTVVSGVEMRAKPNADNPHSLYHLYSYWDLKAKAASGVYGIDHWIDCTTTPGECRVQPKVQIKDNWGWCNGGIDEITGLFANPSGIDDCNQWATFGALVVVKEK